MDPSRIETLMALAIGLSFAGVVFEGFFMISRNRASFSLMFNRGLSGLLAAPLLFATGPFILLDNALRGRRFEKRQAGPVFLATVVALLWSLVSGHVLLGVIDMVAAATI